MFRTLAITDLCVGIISGPLDVATWVSAVKGRWQICRFAYDAAYITGNILCAVSLLTMTAISVDRLLALLLGIRYRQVVTLKRIYLTVTAFCVVPIAYTFMFFLNPDMTSWSAHIGLILCFATSGVCYVKIFFTLRHHQSQVRSSFHQGQRSQTVPFNIARYRKTVFAALWVQVALVVCYLPYGIALALDTEEVVTSSHLLANEVTVSFVYINSSLNPILYCWKIRELKQAVKTTVRQLCYCSVS